MSAAVRPSADGQSLDVATPRTLFPLGTASGGAYPPTFKMDYDVSADGERFLVLQTTDAAATSAITVIANWQPRPR